MKKTIAVLAVLLAAATLFANGAREDALGERGSGYWFENSEEVTLTGTLEVNDEDVVLSTESGDFVVRAPMMRLVDLDEYDGAEIEISGVLHADEDGDTGYDGYIQVQTAVTDGEEYELGVPSRFAGKGVSAQVTEVERPYGEYSGRGMNNTAYSSRGSSARGAMTQSPVNQRGNSARGAGMQSPVNQRGSSTRGAVTQSPVNQRGNSARGAGMQSPVNQRGNNVMGTGIQCPVTQESGVL